MTLLAASDWGLGWVIFDAKEFLEPDVMVSALIVIGFIGYAFERRVGHRCAQQRPGNLHIIKRTCAARSANHGKRTDFADGAPHPDRTDHHRRWMCWTHPPVLA